MFLYSSRFLFAARSLYGLKFGLKIFTKQQTQSSVTKISWKRLIFSIMYAQPHYSASEDKIRIRTIMMEDLCLTSERAEFSICWKPGHSSVCFLVACLHVCGNNILKFSLSPYEFQKAAKSRLLGSTTSL